MSLRTVTITGSKAFAWGRIPYRTLRVDPRIFRVTLPEACWLGACSGKCCSEGVYVSIPERSKILGHAKGIEPLMAGKRHWRSNKWFYGSWTDIDSPSGTVCSTRIENGRCVFQQDKTRFCVLQVYASRNGLHPWFLKPINSIMYPLVVKEGVLTVEDVFDGHDFCGPCRKPGRTVWDACKEELIFLIGPKNYEVLRAASKPFAQGSRKRPSCGPSR